MDGRLGAVQHLFVGGLERAVFGHDLFHPALARRLVAARAQLVHHLAQNGFGAAHDSDVDVAVLPYLRAVHHYLDELRALREHVVRPVAQPEVYGRANEYHGVGVNQPVAPSEAAQIGVVGGDGAAPHGVEEHRRIYHLHELAQLVRRVVPPDVGAGENHRLFGLHDDVRDLAHVLRIAVSLRAGAVRLRIADAVFVRPPVHHVDGDFEIRRAGNAGRGVSEGDSHVLRDALDALDLLGELGDGLEERGGVEILQPAAQVVGNAGVAADEDHRAGRLEGVGDAGDGVGDAGPRRDDSHARLAGDLRPPFGGVGGDLLVPEVDYLDALGHAALVKVVNVAAVEREDVLDALALERFGEQSSAVYLCHFFSCDFACVQFDFSGEYARRPRRR